MNYMFHKNIGLAFLFFLISFFSGRAHIQEESKLVSGDITIGLENNVNLRQPKINGLLINGSNAS